MPHDDLGDSTATPTPDEGSPASALPGKPVNVRSHVDRWKRQLLDLSGRNRALNYRPSRQTLEIHAAEPDAWAALVDGDGIRLVEATLVGTPAASTAGSTPATREASYDAALRRLKQLGETNRTFMEEQGVHVLHACVGWLTWADDTRAPGPNDEGVDLPNGRRARVVRSPLVFVPVRVEKDGREQRLVREPNAPIEPNITLIHLMEHQYGLRVSVDEDDELTPETVIRAWDRAIEGRRHWATSMGDSTRVDTFSFKKIALLREMERLIDVIAEQEVLRALCGDADPLIASSSIRDIRSLDREVSPADVALVVPADSSQLRAVLAVQDGASLVVQGPPGTGKSQTITNLIADTIAAGKRVLFVAEKRAARDVVVGNLEEAGLGEVVLHITEEVSGARGGAGAKRDIADQIAAILERGPGEYASNAGSVDRVASFRSKLNEYVDHLHAPLGPAPWSTPYRLLARWAAFDETDIVAEPPTVPSISAVDDAWLDRVLEVAASIDDLGESVLQQVAAPWLASPVTEWNAADAGPILAAVSTVADAQDRLDGILQGRPIASTHSTATVPDLRALAATLRALSTYEGIRESWLRWFMPRFWSLRGVAKRWGRAGGQEPTGDEAETATAIEALLADLDTARSILRRWLPSYPETDDLANLTGAADPLRSTEAILEATVRARGRAARGASDSIEEALLALLRQRNAGASIRGQLDAVLRYRWASEALKSHPSLTVETPTRERLRTRFQEADEALRRHAVAVTLNAVAPKRPGMDGIAPRESELGVLRQQVQAKRRKPLRWLFSKAATAILQLKPCIVTSPLGVAQFLHHSAYKFDVVIFDEASQIPTADAVVPMAHGKQVVVVGDSQQMPPTSFFDRTIDSASDEDEDDTTTTPFESVLQECETLLPTRRLLWHYRSRDERLIAFSNHLFYDGSLLTFPASWSEHPARGVHFEYVANAIYGRGGSRTNPQEAERVIELLTEELIRSPEQEVAITAMSIAQGKEIQERIEASAGASEPLQRWLDAGVRVKNLETIQGDECDTMILSFGYGKDAGGTPVLNFGPLSRDDGYRRLNVAVTRARQKTILVSSLRATDIPPTVGSGGQLVRRYLDYAERGPIALVEDLRASGIDQFDSVFEEEVARQLRARGWSVDTQVGVSRFRIDLGVRDPDEPGRYLAGIECDGATYHGSESARDRDITRQAVLERLGWAIFRIWSPDWFSNRQAVVADLDAWLRELHAEGQQGATSAPARPHLAAEPSVPQPSAIEFKQSDPTLPRGTVPYEPHVPSRPRGGLQQWVTRLIESEGPLHEDELLQALRDDHGYGRLGAIIRREFEAAIAGAERSGGITRRGVWLWPPALDVSVVEVRVRAGEARRRFEWYSDEELVRVVRIACSITGSLNRDGLIEATARLLGVNLTQAVRERIDKTLDLTVTSGHLIDRDGVLSQQ
ncbi:MAG: DUF3320 domain-containing protein [Dehalococcoidia bacterium]|nr:DUF3320 domain-containing protein [Dehalococcoidia bacterium]